MRLNVVGQITYTTPISNMHSITATPRPRCGPLACATRGVIRLTGRAGDFYVGDVGQGEWEEVSALPANSPAGKNLGWSNREGKHSYSNSCAASPIPRIDPVAEYNHAESTGPCSSVTGGFVYRGGSQPWLNGNYFYGDACSGQLWALWQPQLGTYTHTQILDTDWAIVSFGEDKQGELYVVHHGGTVYRFASKLLLKATFMPIVIK